MKKRHLKTTIERYCEPCRFKTRNDLISYTIQFNNTLKLYYNSLLKTNSKFVFNDALNFCGVKHKGIFYLDEDTADRIIYEDTPPLSQTLEKRDGKYTKFYILEGSEDKHILVLYFNIHNNLDYDFLNANKILLEGNVGIYI